MEYRATALPGAAMAITTQAAEKLYRAAAIMGDPNASIPTPQPEYFRPMFGAYGRAVAESSVTFVSQAFLESGLLGEFVKRFLPVRNTRKIGKHSMILNNLVPHMEVDPETYEVRANGQLLTCEPVKISPWLNAILCTERRTSSRRRKRLRQPGKQEERNSERQAVFPVEIGFAAMAFLALAELSRLCIQLFARYRWAVAAGQIVDRDTLVDWLQADLCYGAGRDKAILFLHARQCVDADDRDGLFDVAELAAAYRGTGEFALESSQPATAYLATLRNVWPDRYLDWLAEALQRSGIAPAVSVVLGVQAVRQQIIPNLALPTFLQAYAANLITAGIRLIPIGQLDGQLTLSALEEAVLTVSTETGDATLADLGSAAFMIEMASTFHETQQPRLFRT